MSYNQSERARMPTEVFYIPCRIESGGFTSERTFEIDDFRGGILVGTAYMDHLRDINKKPLDEDVPGYGESIKGFVRCLKIKDIDENAVLVELPSADVIHVSKDDLVPG